MMQRVVGHLVNFFGLNKPALSAIFRLYEFIAQDLTDTMRFFSQHVDHELKLLAGLIFVSAEITLNLPTHSAVFLGDSSSKGYALAVTEARAGDILTARRHHERWRFLNVEPEFVGREEWSRQRE